MKSIDEISNNPFIPGFPTPPSNFIGRSGDVEMILRYLPRVISHGIPEHFFITGKRGMGKTSFIRYVASIAKKDYNMIPVYINNDGSNTIEDLIINLIESLFKEFDKTSNGRKIINSFVERFKGVNIGGFGFTLSEKPDVVMDVKKNFREFLVEICNDLDDEENGIFFIIDDLNGLSQTPDFANWYKGLFETLGFYEEFTPIVFSLITYPDKFYQLCEQNPSFPRMFNLMTIDKLDDEDIKQFFIDRFKSINVNFEKEQYLEDMVYYSCGMALVMQEIGNSIFWNLKSNCLDESTVYGGIENTSIYLENQYLKNSLEEIKSPHYKNILLKLGKNRLFKFNKLDVIKLLNETEINVFDDFIDKMIVLKVIEATGEEDTYEFVNILYYAYFLIISTLR